MKPQESQTRTRKNVSFGKFRRWAALIVFWSALGVGLTILRISHPAFGVQGDLPLHYHITRAYDSNLREGQWLPRWAGLMDGGRGDALFTFYPPLSYLLTGGLAHLPGVDFLTSIKLVLVLVFFLAQASAYYFARCFTSAGRALVTGTLYALLPAFSMIALSRGFFANGLALGIAPLVLAGCHRILTDEKAGRGVALFAAATSAVVLTHAITTYLCGVAVGLMIVSYLPWIVRSRLLRLCGAVLLTIALTAFFLVPQRLEMSWVKLGLQLSQQDFRDSLLFANPRDDSQYRRVWAGLNQVAGYLTLAQTALALVLGLACAPMLRRRANPSHAAPVLWFGLALAAVGLLISLPASAPLWELIPGLRYIQFPWRFQPFTALGCGLMAAQLPEVWKGMNPFPRVLTVAGIGITGGVCLLFTFLLIRLVQPGVAAAEVANRLEARGQWSVQPISMEEGRGLQSSNERAFTAYTANQIYFRPSAADQNFYPPTPAPGGLSFVSGAGETRSIRLTNADRVFQIEAREPSTVRLETYGYPHWVATLDGREIPIRTEPGDGRMLIDVPAGTSLLSAKFLVRNPVERAARWVSALSWLGFFGVMAFRRR